MESMRAIIKYRSAKSTQASLEESRIQQDVSSSFRHREALCQPRRSSTRALFVGSWSLPRLPPFCETVGGLFQAHYFVGSNQSNLITVKLLLLAFVSRRPLEGCSKSPPEAANE